MWARGQVVGYIGKSDWARARTALRLYTYETRKSMTRLSDAKSVDPVSPSLLFVGEGARMLCVDVVCFRFEAHGCPVLLREDAAETGKQPQGRLVRYLRSACTCRAADSRAALS
jgi:hypothetical protein